MLGSKQKTPGRGHWDLPDLTNHGSEPSVTQAFLHDGKHILVTAAFGLDQPVRSQSGLRQTWSEQVTPAQRPQHRAPFGRGARGKAGGKQERSRVVADAGTRPCHFVQRTKHDAAARDPAVHRVHAERQAFRSLGPVRDFDSPDLCTQSVQAKLRRWR